MRVKSCYGVDMARGSRVNVTLGEAHAAKLSRLAERTHVNEGTIAGSLLAQAIDDTDIDPRHIVDVLDRIPGAWARIDRGIEDARAGRTVGLDNL